MRNLVKIGLTVCMMLGLNSFANDTAVNKQYVDNATKDGLINHFELPLPEGRRFLTKNS